MQLYDIKPGMSLFWNPCGTDPKGHLCVQCLVKKIVKRRVVIDMGSMLTMTTITKTVRARELTPI